MGSCKRPDVNSFGCHLWLFVWSHCWKCRWCIFLGITLYFWWISLYLLGNTRTRPPERRGLEWIVETNLFLAVGNRLYGRCYAATSLEKKCRLSIIGKALGEVVRDKVLSMQQVFASRVRYHLRWKNSFWHILYVMWCTALGSWPTVDCDISEEEVLDINHHKRHFNVHILYLRFCSKSFIQIFSV